MFGFAGTRSWVYTQSIDGRFQRIRRWTFAVLHVVLFGLPWLSIRGNPALRIDLPGRHLYAFGAIFTPKDAILLLLLMLFLAFSLFFFTSLFGRLWCGYACPQTVFLDSWVRPFERWIEGEHTTRRRRDAGPWTFDRARRKAAKWAVFAVAATIVAMTLMSYFTGAVALWTGRASGTAYALTGFFAALWFLDFAWFREQFCNYLCPYARFQSVLVDDHTLTVAYDEWRGEPRGGREARVEGRCIECNKCVNVCPHGIDIRNGFQLECIGCARCIDACESVMSKFGHESLIGYHSLVQIRPTGAAEERAAGVVAAGVNDPARQPPSTRRPSWRRPRVAAYTVLLLGLMSGMATVVRNRVPFEIGVARTPGSLYQIDGDGWVRNTFLLRVANNAPTGDGESMEFEVEVEGLPGAEVVAPHISLRSSESRTLPLVVRLPASDTSSRTLPIRVHVRGPTGERVLDTTFKTGGREHGGR